MRGWGRGKAQGINHLPHLHSHGCTRRPDSASYRIFNKVPIVYHTGKEDDARAGAFYAYRGDKVRVRVCGWGFESPSSRLLDLPPRASEPLLSPLFSLPVDPALKPSHVCGSHSPPSTPHARRTSPTSGPGAPSPSPAGSRTCRARCSTATRTGCSSRRSAPSTSRTRSSRSSSPASCCRLSSSTRRTSRCRACTSSGA